MMTNRNKTVTLRLFLFCLLICHGIGALSKDLSSACFEYSEPGVLGYTDPLVINRSSGMSHSSIEFQRVFHVNEESGPFVYVTDLKGRTLQTLSIKSFQPFDVEDLAYGPCGPKAPASNCLVIGDIGDNYLNRDKPLELIFMKDQKQLSDTVEPLGRVFLRYPTDKKHDAESLAMHPNGDIYILTKEVDLKGRQVFPAIFYRVKKQQWEYFPNQVLTLEKVGEIDFSYLLYEDGFWGRQPTGFDISEDGKSFIVITYKNAIEFYFDLSEKNAIPNFQNIREFRDYHIVKLKKLPQQEAISYLRGLKTQGFIYTSAYHGAAVPLMASLCRPNY